MALKGFIDSLLPEDYTILAVPLRPYCLGHFFHMVKEGCSYASDNQEQMASIEDLLLAVSICCRTFEEFKEFKADKEAFEDWHIRWGKVIDGLLTQPNFDMLYEFQRFKRYLEEGVKPPRFWVLSNGTGGKTGQHWAEALMTLLQTEFKFSESDALNMPITHANHMRAQLLASNGQIQLRRDL